MSVSNWKIFPEYTEGYFILEKIAERRKKERERKEIKGLEQLIYNACKTKRLYDKKILDSIIMYAVPPQKREQKDVENIMYKLIELIYKWEGWLNQYVALTDKVPLWFVEEVYETIME